MSVEYNYGGADTKDFSLFSPFLAEMSSLVIATT